MAWFARLLRCMQPALAFLIVSERKQFLFKLQVPIARFRRAAHAGEAMVFRRFRPIFGGTNHRLLPHNAIRPIGGKHDGTLEGVPSMKSEMNARTHWLCVSALRFERRQL